MIGIAAALVLVVAPLLAGVTGWIRARGEREDTTSTATWDWKLIIGSALLYTLAFNLVFFIQELFLVLPKAFTPGLRPTLFHNNHRWEGDHPLASLFQGTGALATVLTAILCMLTLRGTRIRSGTLRLFLIWTAYSGLFQALPQVVIGAINPQNDVGMAMDWLQMGTGAKTAAALIALMAIPLAALLLTRALLGLAENPGDTTSARRRSHFVFQAATLPALVAVPLIIPFRVPREWIEVVMPPLVGTLIGTAWMQAWAWHIRNIKPAAAARLRSIVYPLLATLILLLVFQLLLRPGIAFYRQG